MNFIIRFFKRRAFGKTIDSDQTINVVNGMVKARQLYKKLSAMSHPDRNPEQREEAEGLFKRVVKSKYDYEALKMLEKEIGERLSQI
jgi:hypothetical protein